ncbi:MAG: hypothetical protein WA962_02470 [Ornithinimicrobium sp.]
MRRITLRLAAVAITTTVGMLLIPATASAESASPPMIANIRGHASMADKMQGHASMADALQAHPELAGMKMPDRHMVGGAMAAKMQGHASMADALQAHPELAGMNPHTVFSS